MKTSFKKNSQKFFEKISFSSFVWISVLFISCKENLVSEKAAEKVVTNQKSARIQAIDYKISAAKLLAKAVRNEGVRRLIKEEAIEKIDGDYDVFFQLVKNKKIDGKQSLIDYISSLADSPDEFKTISDNLPLLTIFVPTFFNAEKWDVINQIPVIAVRNENDQLIVFNEKGESDELSPKEEPNFPIIVLKNSDKIVSGKSGKNLRVTGSNSNTFIFNNGKEDFYFIDESLNNINPKNKQARQAPLQYTGGNDPVAIDPLLLEAYEKSSGCNDCTHRDWIYYGINSKIGQDKGSLNIKFEEGITAIEFANTGGLDLVGGWDEGTFIFKVTASFGDRKNPVVSALQKTIAVAPEKLFKYRLETRRRGIFGINSYTVKIVEGVKPYHPSSPITFVPWDMQKYGDSWAIVAEEYDEAETIVRTYENTSTFGFNFDLTFKIFKIGAALGIKGSETKTTKTTYSSTIDNDQLGNAIISWSSPIVTGPVVQSIRGNYVNTYVANTGALKISLEPVRVTQ